MKYRKMSIEPADINTAIVLTGGGAKGAYQVGVIKQLLKMGVNFDMVTGTSIGALNAALLSEFVQKGLSPAQIAAQLESAWLSFQNFMTLNWSGFLKNIFTLSNISSIYTNKYIKKALCQYIPTQRSFSDYTKCQLSITGTNLSRKELQIFDFNSTIPVVDAVLASMAYPVAFPAVNIEGEIVIDGGALSNAPLKEAIQWGARNIYLVFLRPLSIIKEFDISNIILDGMKVDIRNLNTPADIVDEGNTMLEKKGIFNDHTSKSKKKNYSALEVIDEFLDMAVNRLMYGDLKHAEKTNQLIDLINKYQHMLPSGFIRELRHLFGLKYKGGKRVIKVTRIAPIKVLKPPGLRGFNQQKAIRDIMQQGEEDTRKAIRQL
ncbi:MAG: patatin-like phospholipase family protein [Halanaerobiales bacterium]